MSAEVRAPTLPAELAQVTQLYRSEMLRSWGFLYFLSGLWFFFRKLKMTEPSAERVRRAAERGPVVYVLRTRSEIDYLALNEVLRRRRLPLARFGTAVSTLPWMPLFEMLTRAWEGIRHRLRNGRMPNPVESGFLEQLVVQNHHTAVFLRLESD